MSDTISLHALTLICAVGHDAWLRTRPQPLLLTVHILFAPHALAHAGRTDGLAHSLHYGLLADALLALQAPHRQFASLVALAQEAASVALAMAAPLQGVQEVRVLAEAPKIFLRARALVVDLVRTDAQHPTQDSITITIKDLSVPTIIGVNPPERKHKQQLVASVAFIQPSNPSAFPHSTIADLLANHIEQSAFLTLEALATSIARTASSIQDIRRVSVTLQKPSAVAFGHSSGVQLTRDTSFFEDERRADEASATEHAFPSLPLGSSK